MKKIQLKKIAHARSGDKGDSSNVGLIAYKQEYYPILCAQVTPEAVRRHFSKIANGPVDRYEVPNLLALNFIIHDSLGGGGTESLKTDAQGKTHGMGLLEMEIEVPDDLIVA
ncbi:hypothetical protein L6Q79_01360 [bacterium]|nr:hypothetical protein [bacterium]NUN45557.1 hypothetical protein [bacterium]